MKKLLWATLLFSVFTFCNHNKFKLDAMENSASPCPITLCSDCGEKITDAHASADLLACEHNSLYHQSCLYQLFDKELSGRIKPFCPLCHQEIRDEQIKKMYLARWFLNAVICGNSAAVGYSVSNGFDITNIRDQSKGDTALHIAAQCNYPEIADFILSSIKHHEITVDFINTKNNMGFTAGHLAAMYGHTDILDIMLNHLSTEGKIATLMIPTIIEETTMQIIISRCDIGMLTTVLSHFSGLERFSLLSAQDRNGSTALHIAAQEGHVSLISTILDLLPKAQYKKALIDVKNNYRKTALTLAFLNLSPASAEEIKRLFSKHLIKTCWSSKIL